MGKFIPIEIGTKFGDLTVIGKPFRSVIGLGTNRTIRAMFPCVCKCGKQTAITGSQLRSGSRVRCSDCAYRERPQSTMRLSNLERMFNMHIVKRCKGTNIKNELTLEQYDDLIHKNCHYCGEEPRFINHLSKNKIALKEDFYANGIDRVDPSKNYTLTNCVPCCKRCNFMKGTLGKEEFINQIFKIYNNLWKKQNDTITEK